MNLARDTRKSYLFEFQLKVSDDATTPTIVLVHGPCRDVVCDVKTGESIEALVDVTTHHRCLRRWSDYPSDGLVGCLSGRFTAEDVNRAFDQIYAECGINLVCVWDSVESNEPGGHRGFYADISSGLLQELTPEAVRWLSANPEVCEPPAPPGVVWVWPGDVAEFVLEDLYWNDGRHNYAATPRSAHDSLT